MLRIKRFIKKIFFYIILYWISVDISQKKTLITSFRKSISIENAQETFYK